MTQFEFIYYYHYAEPDDKSEGFMDGALNGFPNLKSFGGFDAMPDIAREGI